MQASRSGDIQAVRRLLAYGARVNLRTKSGGTALMDAASGGKSAIIQLLLEHKADPDVTITDKNDGRTALMFAVSEGHVEAVRLLLEHGASVNIADRYDHWNALTCAVNQQDITMVTLLLAHGADARIRDKEGKGLLALLKDRDPTDRFAIAPLLKQAGATE
jgi:ankyrin repeat protein